MKKEQTKEPAKSEVIIKTENERVLIKFKPEEIEEKQMYLSGLLMQKFELENLIEESKKKIKDREDQLKKTKKELTLGGIEEWEDCEVKIYPDTMKKEYYFNGELVKTVDAKTWDLQLEIDEEEEEETAED